MKSLSKHTTHVTQKNAKMFADKQYITLVYLHAAKYSA